MNNTNNSVKITLIIAVAIVVLVILGFVAINGFVNTGSNTVSVDGQSLIKVTPDLVTIYFDVETNGSTAREAKDANSIIVDKLTSNLLALDFSKEEIQTEGFNIYEDIRWENDRQKSYGFKASHQIKIEMNTSFASKISDVIDAGVDAGALLQYINFELTTQKQNEYKTQALKEASQDAKTKAEAIASGLGKRVGKLVSISTSNYDYRPWNLYTASAGGMMEDVAQAKVAVNNIQPGSQEVSAYVSAVYKIV
jgi:uncharacterized protein YggE